MKIVLLYSGGLDSTCFGIYLKYHEFHEIYPIIINYGQRHSTEIRRAKRIAKALGFAKPVVVRVDLRKITSSLLLEKSGNISSASSAIVPFRNIIFLSIASSYAKRLGTKFVAYGAVSEEGVEFPDCSLGFQMEFEKIAARSGEEIRIYSPAKYGWRKEDLIKLAYRELKAIGKERILYRTISCYNGTNCGTCLSCQKRKKAFQIAGVPDKTRYLVE
ncbi:MAG: 7-cyano-7-deazaguanine synthase [Candidatus Nanoarchaeia archaeon]|nr:7-cyano-7-deazaguanine synthase [Candidatus Jingweiarchaeum tengchongense]